MGSRIPERVKVLPKTSWAPLGTLGPEAGKAAAPGPVVLQRAKATKGSNLYVTDPLKNVELEKIVPDPRPYIDEQAPVPVKATNAYDFVFGGGFGDDFSGFTDFKPDQCSHMYQDQQDYPSFLYN